MKRKMLSLLLMFVMVFGLVSCGGSSGPDAFVGTWKIESMDAMGMQITKEALTTFGYDDWSLDIDADCNVTMNIMGQSETIQGEVSGKTLKLTDPDQGQTIDLTLEGGKLVMDLSVMGEEGKVTFSK